MTVRNSNFDRYFLKIENIQKSDSSANKVNTSFAIHKTELKYASDMYLEYVHKYRK